jgi:hypothetical protein
MSNSTNAIHLDDFLEWVKAAFGVEVYAECRTALQTRPNIPAEEFDAVAHEVLTTAMKSIYPDEVPLYESNEEPFTSD